jgi:prepilin-type processing-associated H-X9-DG protein
MTYGIAFPYSYTVNDSILLHWSYFAMHPPKVTIRAPSSKILAIEESADYMDKGCFAVDEVRSYRFKLLSNRHGANRANIVFADGHCDFVDRALFTKAAAEVAAIPSCLDPHAR